ncbi:MAG: dihydropteroate synthase [Phycisphaerales bacterium]
MSRAAPSQVDPGDLGSAASVWSVRGRGLPLEPWVLMGIVNATPDSFSDGGLHLDPARAAEAALAMIDAGASIIDVGGESTRPGASRIDAAEQIRRVVPVIEAIRRQGDVTISIDTTLAAVAEAAIDAGAEIVNDVSAGEEDPSILRLAAARSCGVVLMHRLAPPPADSFSDRYAEPPEYRDVVGEVQAALLARISIAEGAGVDPRSIAIDPGLGFGKSVEQNFALIARLGELASLGRPVLVGASRKSFIGAVSGTSDPAQRVPGSVVAAVAAWSAGGRIIRTHDVAETRQGLEVARAILKATRLAL